MKLKSVFQFSSPYEYLSHIYQFHKRNTGGFSYATFSEKAGIKSPNYLKQIIDQKKKMTNDKLCLVSKALELSFEEQIYFEQLVHFNQATDEVEKSYYKKKVNHLKIEARKYNYARTKSLSLIEDWRIPILLLFLDRSSIDTNLRSVARRLSLSYERVQEIVKMLVSEGYLEVVQNKFEMSDKYLLLKSSLPTKTTMKRFLSQSLQLSQKSFQSRYDKDKFYSQYFKINKEDLKAYHELIDKLVHQMSEQSEEDKGQGIYLLNVQFLDVLGVANV